MLVLLLSAVILYLISISAALLTVCIRKTLCFLLPENTLKLSVIYYLILLTSVTITV